MLFSAFYLLKINFELSLKTKLLYKEWIGSPFRTETHLVYYKIINFCILKCLKYKLYILLLLDLESTYSD